MGGPVVRTMALQSDFSNDYSNPTYGKGPVHVLITIAGVHLGAAMADYLMTHRCLAEVFRFFGKNPYGGAVEGLMVNSPQMKKIKDRQTPFPVITIAGLADQNDRLENEKRINWVMQLPLLKESFGIARFSFDRLTDSEEHYRAALTDGGCKPGTTLATARGVILSLSSSLQTG